MSRAINEYTVRSAVIARWLETKGEPTTIKQLAARSGYSESALRRATSETLHKDLCWTNVYVETMTVHGNVKATKTMAIRPTDEALCEMIIALRSTLEDTKKMFSGMNS